MIQARMILSTIGEVCGLIISAMECSKNRDMMIFTL